MSQFSRSTADNLALPITYTNIPAAKHSTVLKNDLSGGRTLQPTRLRAGDDDDDDDDDDDASSRQKNRRQQIK